MLEAERHKQEARRTQPENKEDQRIMRTIMRKKQIIDQMRSANPGQEDTPKIKASVNDLVETVKSELQHQKKLGNDSGLKPQSLQIQNQTETEISQTIKVNPEEFARKHFLNLQKYESMYKSINKEIERQIALFP
jgi:hypothetical protein